MVGAEGCVFLQWTLAGRGRVVLPNGSADLPPGMGVIWQSAHPVITALADGEPYWQWLRVDLRGCDAIAVELITRGHARFALPLSDPITTDLLAYHRPGFSKDAGCECHMAEVAQLAARLLGIVCAELPSAGSDPLIEAIEGIIRREGLARHGIEHLARRLGCSGDHLARQFRRVAGVSLATYLRQRVMVWARTMILAGDRPIVEISRMLGYQSSAHFSRAFRSIHGVTPTEVRRSR
jgi:AraC-like DNA-binding protein